MSCQGAEGSACPPAGDATTMPPPDGPTPAAKSSAALWSGGWRTSSPALIGIGTGTFLILGLAIVLVYHKGVAVGWFWSLASFGVGTVVGFLFGFPRTVQREVV